MLEMEIVPSRGTGYDMLGPGRDRRACDVVLSLERLHRSFFFCNDGLGHSGGGVSSH